jgi:hypothetical protein
MWHIARKQYHQPGIRLEQNVRRRQLGEEDIGARWVRVVKMDGRAFGVGTRLPTIDVVNPQPGCAWMGMHLVKIASPVDVGPGTENPICGLRRPGRFGVGAACRLLDHVARHPHRIPACRARNASRRHWSASGPDAAAHIPECFRATAGSAPCYRPTCATATELQKDFRRVPLPILASPSRPRSETPRQLNHPGTGQKRFI